LQDAIQENGVPGKDRRALLRAPRMS
jgi:hypothetical protein